MKKIVLVNDALLPITQFLGILKNVDECECFGILIRRYSTEVFDKDKLRLDLGIEDVVRGADIIFLDHDMPTQGDIFLGDLRNVGFVGNETLIVGTSTRDQQYVDCQVDLVDASDVGVIERLLRERKKS